MSSDGTVLAGCLLYTVWWFEVAEVENSKLIIYLRAIMIVLGYGLRITTQYMGHVLRRVGRVMYTSIRVVSALEYPGALLTRSSPGIKD